jgi:hypothetical protein
VASLTPQWIFGDIPANVLEFLIASDDVFVITPLPERGGGVAKHVAVSRVHIDLKPVTTRPSGVLRGFFLATQMVRK